MALTKTVNTRIDPAYYSILEILTKKAGMQNVSEFIRSVLMKVIMDQFEEDPIYKEKPAAYYLHLSEAMLTKGIEKLKTEFPEFALDIDRVKNPK